MSLLFQKIYDRKKAYKRVLKKIVKIRNNELDIHDAELDSKELELITYALEDAIKNY